MDDNGRGRLSGVELVLFGQRGAARLGAEQLQERFLVGEVRAGRIAE
jgi:hypothetical protein